MSSDYASNNSSQERVKEYAIQHSVGYIGYCGIKNTAQQPWEIAIELLPQ